MACRGSRSAVELSTAGNSTDLLTEGLLRCRRMYAVEE
jgi:hypothetical protein